MPKFKIVIHVASALPMSKQKVESLVAFSAQHWVYADDVHSTWKISQCKGPKRKGPWYIEHKGVKHEMPYKTRREASSDIIYRILHGAVGLVNNFTVWSKKTSDYKIVN